MSQRAEEMLHPVLPFAPAAGGACRGTAACADALAKALAGRERVTVVLECYPGVNQDELLAMLEPLGFDTVLHADDCALEPADLDAALARDLTDDRVFGILSVRKLADYFLPEKLEAARKAAAAGRRVLVYGVGATLVTRGDLLLYADITRWELQLRFRRGADNWRTARHGLPKLSKYKCGYFGATRSKRPACRRLTITLTQQPRAPPPCCRGTITAPRWPRRPAGRSAWPLTTTRASGAATG